jgi:hypothetical protein
MTPKEDSEKKELSDEGKIAEQSSPDKLEVWTENLRKALWQSNPKVTIRQHTPNSSDKTETRFIFPNTPNKTLNP